ncbi:Metaxin-1 [Frankliniella fusca]|uniref:Metaxin-1 n=1 Tax=Frankliniella fusca TaxID=407009 RepID=A0AAE1LL94_9NEOP|nr:Metaxin-1 [Frankliniella fusca]
MSPLSMEVDVWAGKWDLPSVDQQCLQIMAYAKFCGAPIKVNVTNNPFWSPSGSLPVFRHGKDKITSFQSMISFLESKKYSADLKLTPLQKSECYAINKLLEGKLHPAILYTWWVDETNYIELTRPWYASVLPLPFNYYYPGRYERDAKKYVETMFIEDEDQSVIETHLLSDAEKCLTSLSVRLGDENYFFGKSPTSLDAIVYSYLAPLVKVPFQQCALQNHLKACPNLMAFVGRISRGYFPVLSDASKNINLEKAKEVELRNKRLRNAFSLLFAFASMTGFALYNNIYQEARLGRRFATKLERIKDRWRGRPLSLDFFASGYEEE